MESDETLNDRLMESGRKSEELDDSISVWSWLTDWCLN